MNLGFKLSGPDNDSYMLQKAARVPRCGSCRIALTHDWINPEFTLVVTRLDLSYTYDGYCIVSQRFRETLSDRGAIYRELAAVPEFFALYADDVVQFDAGRRGTRFENF